MPPDSAQEDFKFFADGAVGVHECSLDTRKMTLNLCVDEADDGNERSLSAYRRTLNDNKHHHSATKTRSIHYRQISDVNQIKPTTEDQAAGSNQNQSMPIVKY